MRYFISTCLLGLTLAAFVIGCGSDSNPRAIDVKQDSRIQRVGEGNPQQGKPENNQALRP